MALAITGVGGNSGIVQRVGAEPEWFEVEVTTTAPGQTYSWQIVTGTAISATTEWGDGTTSTHTVAGAYTKTYASAGVYTVRIKASFGSNGWFTLRPFADRTRLTGLLSPIPAFSGLTSIRDLCNGCTGLATPLIQDFLRYINPSNISGTFTGCSNLSGSVPVGFFQWSTLATNFNFVLSFCPRLQLQPDLFGPSPSTFFSARTGVTLAEAFRFMGTQAGTPQGTAPSLWTYTYGSPPVTTNCFGDNNATNLSNWAQIPAAWGGPA